MKLRHPAHDDHRLRAQSPYDTFGWGVVFSDKSMEAIRRADPESAAEIADTFGHWDDIDFCSTASGCARPATASSASGASVCSTSSRRRCERLGVKLVFEQRGRSDLDCPTPTSLSPPTASTPPFANATPTFSSPTSSCAPTASSGSAAQALRRLHLRFRRTEHGWFQAHIYKFDADTSTFIVETTEETLLAHGLDKSTRTPQSPSAKSCSPSARRRQLMTNARHLRGSAWLGFTRVICDVVAFQRPLHVVLMGDAAHTAHFAIGSGTSWPSRTPSNSPTSTFSATGYRRALDAYEEMRARRRARAECRAQRDGVVRGCRSRYAESLEPEQFFYSMLTRSQRISHENVRMRDPASWRGRAWFAERAGVIAGQRTRRRRC